MKVIHICLLILCAPFVVDATNERSPLVRGSQSSSSGLREVVMSINSTDDDSKSYGSLFNEQTIKENNFHLSQIPGIIPAGQEMVEQSIKHYLNELTEAERSLVIMHLLDANFTVTPVWRNSWQIIAGLCEPLGELAQVGVVVASLWPNWKSDDPEYSKRFANMTGAVTAGFGIVSLFFSKIATYATGKVRSWERVINCLNALKERTQDEETV